VFCDPPFRGDVKNSFELLSLLCISEVCAPSTCVFVSSVCVCVCVNG
jgi:hypothetical protein